MDLSRVRDLLRRSPAAAESDPGRADESGPGRAGGRRAVAGPDSVEVGATWVRSGNGYATTLAVVGYPSDVAPGWLEPLVAYPGRLDVSLHIEPVPNAVAAQRLKTQRSRLEATRRHDAAHGRLDDPDVDAAAGDAAELAARIAQGAGKLFRVGLYLTVWARTREALAEDVAQVCSLASSLLLDARPTTWRALQGWATALPLAVDRIGLRRTLDTSALAASFPFTSPDLPPSDPARPHVARGIFYGLNAASSGVIVWDTFSRANHNALVLASSGAGKSYFTKLELLRSMYDGVHAVVVDPEDEYVRLAGAVGGAVIRLGAAGVKLNPFDLPHPDHAPEDALTRQVLFTHTVITTLLDRKLAPNETAAIDRAAGNAYRACGITADPHTWLRPAPLMSDLAAQLATDTDPAGPQLANELAPYVSGSWRGLFDGPTTTRPAGHLVVFSLRELPEELRAIGTLLALDVAWRQASNPRDRRRRLVVIDEAWLLLRTNHGTNTVLRFAKSLRKYWGGLRLITQDVADLLSSGLGQAVINNSATHILLRQSALALPAVADAFGLTAGQRSWLATAPQGYGLMLADGHPVAFRVIASAFEHRLVTTNPAELADLDDLDDVDDAPARDADIDIGPGQAMAA